VGEKARNVVIAQSGGPSAVINSTLAGIVDGCRSYPDRFGRLFGAWHGIEGVLKEELLDLSAQDAGELELLRVTPAAGAIGTCRYKLRPHQAQDFDRVVEVLRAQNVGYFFYIGGNDSMDTAHKISELAHESGLELIAVGGPKTIDNDVGDAEFKLIDHTPGYGSTARYMACTVQNVEEENRGSAPADPVMVIQAMGRRIGFIPAAARLADPERKMPLLIAMAESGISLPQLGERVLSCLEQQGRCIVVVSEGFDVGELGESRDSFGHVQFGSSQLSAAQVVSNYLNSLTFPVPGKSRYQIPGTDQRHAAIYASTVDLDEAYEVGLKCARIAVEDGNGWMGSILREPEGVYRVRYDKAPLQAVANSERTFPRHWITSDGLDVTDDFLRYAQPLIGDSWPAIRIEGGLQRFAHLEPNFTEQRCSSYIPENYRMDKQY
jgi:6-phosphofructokinase